MTLPELAIRRPVTTLMILVSMFVTFWFAIGVGSVFIDFFDNFVQRFLCIG